MRTTSASTSDSSFERFVMVIDTHQVLARIPRQYFRDPDGPASAIFDGMFGPREESIAFKINERLKEKGFQLDFVKARELKKVSLRDTAAVIVLDTIPEQLLEKVKSIGCKILFVYESPLMDENAHSELYQQLFSHVLTYVDNENRDDVHVNREELEHVEQISAKPKTSNYCYPVADGLRDDIVPFSERTGFCCAIMSSKATNWSGEALSLRENFIQYFSTNHPDDLSLWGGGWDRSQFARSPVCKGFLDGDKGETMKNFKFTFCPENTGRIPGYITEKFWQAIRNGVIPIYMGPPNVDHYIPKGCYIDLRDFLTADGQLIGDNLYDCLTHITEEEYNIYLGNIQRFMESEEASRFTPSAFASTFANVLIKAASNFQAPN